jgi:hypothetical protein
LPKYRGPGGHQASVGIWCAEKHDRVLIDNLLRAPEAGGASSCLLVFDIGFVLLFELMKDAASKPKDSVVNSGEKDESRFRLLVARSHNGHR